MKCATVKIGGVTAIVCGSPRRTKKCVKCGVNAGTRLCDWKMPFGGTCDKPICGQHTFSPAPNKDLCPDHHVAYTEWQAARASKRKAAK